MESQIAYTLKTKKSFADVVAALEITAPEHQFRVLHIHDVQATLAEKGLQRGPLKILEVCNSGFAHTALQKDMNVALFMPCKFTVYTEGAETIVTLGRPTVISQMMPGAGLERLAEDVEITLKKIMHQAVGQ
jgi:uncharacterized protein (DUF302 family)